MWAIVEAMRWLLLIVSVHVVIAARIRRQGLDLSSEIGVLLEDAVFNITQIWTEDVGSELREQKEDLAGAIGVLRTAVLKLTHIAEKEHDPMTKECPTPFVNIIGQCFYINSKVKSDFDEARRTCKGMDADLAQPLYLQALRFYILDNMGGTKYFWIGGSDTKKEGTWVWLPKGPQAGRQITQWWNTGEPNDSAGGDGEDCLVFETNVDANYNKPFNDIACDRKEYFICEFVRSN